MAVLEQIRQRTVLVLIMIGLGMVGFLFMDSTQSGISCSPNEEILIGSIYGEDIGFLEMNKEIKYIEDINPAASKSESFKEAWQNIIETRLIQSAANKLGLTVTSKEQYDLETGNFDIRMVDERFLQMPDKIDENDTIGGQRKQRVDYFKNQVLNNNIGDAQGQLSQEIADSYIAISKFAERNRLKEKYKNLISIGMPSTVIDQEELQSFKNLNVRYLAIDYDLTIDVSDDEIKQYYDKNLSEYQNKEEKRTVEILRFPVRPSEKDISNMKDIFDKLSDQFLLSDDDEVFAITNSSTKWFDNYVGVDNLILEEDKKIDQLIRAGVENSISYVKDNKCRLSKLTEIKEGGEIKVRHILFMVGDTDTTYTQEEAQDKAEEFKRRVESGEDFSVLAKDSDDPSSSKLGGELIMNGIEWHSGNTPLDPGFWEGCVSSDVGDLKIANSQFGVHLINVTGKRPIYKVVSIEKTINASTQTKDRLYSDVKHFIKLASSEDQKLDFKSYVESRDDEIPDLDDPYEITKITYDIPLLQNSRSIVKWVFLANKGDISKTIYNCGNSYVVASLANIELEGDQSFEAVKGKIKKKIQEDRQFSDDSKKILKDDSIDDIAKLFDVEINTDKFNFLNSGNLFDNDLVGIANAIKEGKTSSLIQGENQMYVLEVVGKTEENEAINKSDNLISIEEIINELEKDAEIVNLLHNY